MTNSEAANLFLELADLLDLAGEISFKSSAYRKVAAGLQELDTPFDQLVGAGRWGKIPGAGKAIREKLRTMSETGKLPALDKWRQHQIAVFYPWLDALKLKPRPLGILIRKLGAADFRELLGKLKNQDIAKLTGQAKEAANIIINNS